MYVDPQRGGLRPPARGRDRRRSCSATASSSSSPPTTRERGGRPTRILLVRHGQSTWNADGRWQGQADPPLSPLGEAQAPRASSSPELDGVDALVDAPTSSGRARTAELLAAGRGTVALEPRLRERHAGEWEGLTRAEIEAGWPGFLAEHRRPAGWEDDDVLLERALAAIADIAAAFPGRSRGRRHPRRCDPGRRTALRAPTTSRSRTSADAGSRSRTTTPSGSGERVLLVDVGQVTVPGQI